MIKTYLFNAILILVLSLKSSILICQIEFEVDNKSINLNEMDKKSILIKLCLYNRSDSSVYVNKINKVIYDQSDILKTIKADSKPDIYILKYKLTDTLRNVQHFISIPGYTARNEILDFENLKGYTYIIPERAKICKYYKMDISNLKYKVKSGYCYFMNIFMINGTDTVYAKTPVLFNVKY